MTTPSRRGAATEPTRRELLGISAAWIAVAAVSSSGQAAAPRGSRADGATRETPAQSPCRASPTWARSRRARAAPAARAFRCTPSMPPRAPGRACNSSRRRQPRIPRPRPASPRPLRGPAGGQRSVGLRHRRPHRRPDAHQPPALGRQRSEPSRHRPDREVPRRRQLRGRHGRGPARQRRRLARRAHGRRGDEGGTGPAPHGAARSASAPVPVRPERPVRRGSRQGARPALRLHDRHRHGHARAGGTALHEDQIRRRPAPHRVPSPAAVRVGDQRAGLDGDRLPVRPTGTLEAIQIVPSLPATFTGDNTGAAIVVSPSGRFVYASNRGHDSVAIFRIDESNGMLSPVGWEPTQGSTPRFIGLTPTGTRLFARQPAQRLDCRVPSRSGDRHAQRHRAGRQGQHARVHRVSLTTSERSPRCCERALSSGSQSRECLAPGRTRAR